MSLLPLLCTQTEVKLPAPSAATPGEDATRPASDNVDGVDHEPPADWAAWMTLGDPGDCSRVHSAVAVPDAFIATRGDDDACAPDADRLTGADHVLAE